MLKEVSSYDFDSLAGSPGAATKEAARSTRPLITRIRFQLAGALLLCVLLPAALRINDVTLKGHSAVVNTATGAAIAVAVALYLIRRFNMLPGAKSGSHVLLSVSVPFGVLVAALLVLRFDYSRFVLISSYLTSMGWFLVLHFLAAATIRPKLLVVPGGNADALLDVPDVDWQPLVRPEDARGRSSAVVADLRHSMSEKWQRFLTECALAGIPVYHTKEIKESLTGKVEIEHLSENTFGSILPNLDYLKLKQLADIGLAVLMLPLFAIIYVVVGAIILITSGRPILHVDRRMGYRGKAFDCFKFRTMTVAGEAPAEADPVEASITRENDARITPVGRMLRKYRIDELPQILNVLRGEMSWIGPRPESQALSHWYEGQLPFYRYRHVVRPGISGWAQVHQGHVSSPEEVLEKLHYDFFYIKHISLWLDVAIVMRTIRTILFGFGAK